MERSGHGSPLTSHGTVRQRTSLTARDNGVAKIQLRLDYVGWQAPRDLNQEGASWVTLGDRGAVAV